MRITVTGAAGFIGRRLVRHLLELGHYVKAMTRSGSGLSVMDDGHADEGLEVFQGDVTDPECLNGQLERCDAIVHLAGCTLGRSRREFFRVNVEGTRNVARACAAEPSPPRFIYVSSLAAAGPTRNGQAASESDSAIPVSHYGASKLAAEVALRDWADQMEILIARPASVFGSEDRFMLPLFQLACKGYVVVPGDRSAKYSLMHVDDVVDGLAMLTASRDVECLQPMQEKLVSEGSGIYFFAQAPAMTFTEVANEVASVMGRGPVRTIRVPKFGCWVMGGVNSGVAKLTPLRPLLNADKMREAMAGSWICDSSKLTDDLGYRFQVSLKERIRQTASTYREIGKV